MLLYLANRARPDLQTAVSSLCTRVRQPDEEDRKKLQRTMHYLEATIWLPLTLEAPNNGVTVVKWWVDALYGTHDDFKGHTGAAMSLGKGHPYLASKKQKLNTISSTKSELLGVDDLMPMVFWTRYFLEAQGYNVTTNGMYQDNKSTILLEKNGKSSSGQ